MVLEAQEDEREFMSSERFMVAYAKISIDKDTGIEFQGVYFGGMGSSTEEADVIARECTNSIKGGTVLPKVCKITDGETVIDAMYDATERFEKMMEKMKEADNIINRSPRKR